jgi:hypothetical protein
MGLFGFVEWFVDDGQRYPFISPPAAAPHMPLFLLCLLELYAGQKHLPVQFVPLHPTAILSLLPLLSLPSLSLSTCPVLLAHGKKLILCVRKIKSAVGFVDTGVDEVVGRTGNSGRNRVF